MNSLWPDRIMWMFIRRPIYMSRILGFKAHLNTYVSKECLLSSYVSLFNGVWLRNVNVGKASYIKDAKIVNTQIGSFCSIANKAVIGGVGRHPTNWLSTHPVFYSARKQIAISLNIVREFEELLPVVVGNDVWIGFHAVVLDGINIGDGAIVAAGSIVTKDVPPYAIVGGVPARLIRYRFEPAVIQQMLNWRWWDLPVSVLQSIAPMFTNHKSWSLKHVKEIIKMAESLNAKK